MTDSAPARVAREKRRADVATFLARLMLAHDLTDREASRLTGVAHQHVAQWRDPDAPRAMSLADAHALPEKTRCVLAERLAGGEYALVKLPESGTDACDYRSLSTMQREASDVIAAHIEAFEDGTLDAAEGAKIERDCDELIAIALRLRERARQAQKERVVALRRVGGGK